jgi:hypothetical protein
MNRTQRKEEIKSILWQAMGVFSANARCCF